MKRSTIIQKRKQTHLKLDVLITKFNSSSEPMSKEDEREYLRLSELLSNLPSISPKKTGDLPF